MTKARGGPRPNSKPALKVRQGKVSKKTKGKVVDQMLRMIGKRKGNYKVDVSEKSLEDVVTEMQQAELLVIETRSALPFDTHAINIGTQSSPSSTANQKGFSRPSSALNLKSLLPVQDPLTKKRSYTSFDPDIYYKDNVINKLSQSPKSRGKLSAGSREPGSYHVGESNFYDPSSASDSDESNQSDDKDVTLFHSDSDVLPFLSKVKSFTGKLSVEISKISGIPATDITGSCYCTVEINKEFKAKTRTVPMHGVILFDEEFDIDIQVANVLTIKLFQENRILADKCLSTNNIFLERLFQEENHKRFVLSSTKDSVQTQVNIKFTEARRHLERRQSSRASGIFGFNLSHTLSTEKNTIPILVRKCVGEIETRGLDLEGIYRISGNARKKKELRELFERSSQNVDVSDAATWDCHVITGVLKDYLRKLPKPLISDEMYKTIHEKQLAGGLDPSYERTMLSILIKMAPYVNRATLIFIMDHFQRVLEHVDNNKMTSKNIAVCFGPVMLSPPIEEMKDFQKYIDALELLISIWPKQSNQNMI